VGAFLAGAPRVVLALKLAGIGCLGGTAVRLLLARGGAAPKVRAAAGGRGAAFKQALATQPGNPKAIAFFASLLASLIGLDATWPAPAQRAVYAATTVATELSILEVYGWVAGPRGCAVLRGWPFTLPVASPARAPRPGRGSASARSRGRGHG
jgi:threonine/homoserine/homoserine lactone efflux protein